MGDVKEVTTLARHRADEFFWNSTGCLSFEVKATDNAYVGLSRCGNQYSDYWIVLGKNKDYCAIQIYDATDDKLKCYTPNVLSPKEYRKFWITWHNGLLKFGRDEENMPLVTLSPDDPTKMKKITYFTFRNDSRKAPAIWRFEMPPIIEQLCHKPITGGDLRWVPGTGKVPNEAVVGGYENEMLYIMRALHSGSLTPGKFVPSKGYGVVGWSYKSHIKEEYEVLCGIDYCWVPAIHGSVPVGAIIAGYSECAGEKLYISRAEHEGHLIVGKLQLSHRCCFIPYQGEELHKASYEVLVSPELVYSSTLHNVNQSHKWYH